MTGETHHVPVVIAKRKNILSGLCTLHTSYVADTGTLADLRVVLEGDQIMTTNDKFYVRGQELGRSAERHVRWASAREAECVTVLSPHAAIEDSRDLNAGKGDRDGRVAHPLLPSDSLVDFLDPSLGLAIGVDVSNPDGPRHSGLPVVANLPISQITIMRADREVGEVVVTSSVREAAYVCSGWTKRSIDASLSMMVHPIQGTDTQCSNLAFENAVEDALSSTNEEQRAANLASVFARFGHVYVSSVEMGGMKYIPGTTSKEILRNKEQCEHAMHWALGAKISPFAADASGGKGPATNASAQETLGLEHCVLYTVGGAPGEISLSSWTASLADPTNWALTRVISVEPTINLLNGDIRSRIVAATPQRFMSPPPAYPQIVETGKVWSEGLVHQNPRNIDFVHPAQSTPQLLLGLRALDFDHSKYLRVDCIVDAVTSAAAKLNICSWHDTINYGTCCSWLKIPPSDDDIQCGTYDIASDHPWCKHQETTTHKVVFTRPYALAPKVVAWFHKLDLHCETPYRATVSVHDITREGFTVRVVSWLGAIMHGAGVSWIAISPSRADITCGTYSTFDVRQSGPNSPHTSGRHTFSGSAFTSPPQLFLAISSVDFEKGRDVRFNELCATKVTAEGFEWHLDTRDGSIMYTAAAAYVAFSS